MATFYVQLRCWYMAGDAAPVQILEAETIGQAIDKALERLRKLPNATSLVGVHVAEAHEVRVDHAKGGAA